MRIETLSWCVVVAVAVAVVLFHPVAFHAKVIDVLELGVVACFECVCSLPSTARTADSCDIGPFQTTGYFLPDRSTGATRYIIFAHEPDLFTPSSQMYGCLAFPLLSLYLTT